jgi:hypothetical protein
MRVVGNSGLSVAEQQAQFAFWAIFAAPVIISADLRTMPGESREILLNTEIIAVNQDPLGRQGWCAEKMDQTTLECGFENWNRRPKSSLLQKIPILWQSCWRITIQSSTRRPLHLIPKTMYPMVHRGHSFRFGTW